MNLHKLLAPVLVATASLFASANLHADDTVHTRGWIGGEYKLARPWKFFQNRKTIYTFPKSLAKEQGAGIFISALATNTPAAKGGVQAGDLILKIDGHIV